MKTLTRRRYLVVDLMSGAVLEDRDNLPDALEALDDAKTDHYGDGWDGVSRPDYGVIDAATVTMYDDDRGEIVRCWYDGFAARWRRILEAVA